MVSSKQFDKHTLDYIFRASKEMRTLLDKGTPSDMLKGKILASVFMEPSTRTRSSFLSAMLHLGGRVVPMDNLTSDTMKGETLQDTIRCIENFVDIIVLRHPQVGSAALASKYASIPVINAGDGSGEHPTQALLDMFCILDKFGTIDGLNITIVGDLKYGRTVHSLSYLLAHYNVNINFVSQPQLAMPHDIVDDLRESPAGITVNETSNLESVLGKTDVLYVTRVQKERFSDLSVYLAVKDQYTITPEVMNQLQSKSVVMHPLPRIKEISEQVDDDARCIYFKQPKYGLYVRMALLGALLGKL